jgi:hypothetical protein
MVIEETLGLDRLRTIEFVRDEQPDYLGFEAWVVNELGGNRDDDAIAAWNKSIRNRIHKEGKRTEILSAISLPDDGSLISAVVLNQIEDWHFAHTSLIAD